MRIKTFNRKAQGDSPRRVWFGPGTVPFLITLVSSLTGRVAFLYVLLLVLVFNINMNKGMEKAHRATLSRLIPSYDYLKKYEKGLAPYDQKLIEDYYFYYMEVSRFFTTYPEPHAMLGYLSYQQGKIQDAIRFYERALAMDPEFMNFSLNLGLILLKQGRYAQALPLFNQTMGSTINKNFSNISSSPIYFPFYDSMDTLGKELADKMKKNFDKGYKGVVLSYYLAGDYKECLNAVVIAVTNQFAGDPGFFYFFGGLCLYHLGDYDNAKVFLSNSLVHRLPKDAAELVTSLRPGQGKAAFPDDWPSRAQAVLSNNPWRNDLKLTLF